MSLILEIAKELFGMFMADAKLSCAILVLVGVLAYLLRSGAIDPTVGGAVLLVGCLVILAAVTAIESRASNRRP